MPHIALDQATYILWHDAASAPSHDDKREYQTVITKTMQSLFRTPVHANDDRVKMAQLFAAYSQVNDKASTASDLDDDVDNTGKANSEDGTVFTEASVGLTTVNVNTPETTWEGDSQPASDAITNGDKLAGTSLISADEGLKEDYLSGGRYIPRTGYLVELISEALKTQWVRRTDEFRVFMHEISEDNPNKWATGEGITSLIRKLVRIHA